VRPDVSVDCGGEQASEAMRQLAERQQVTLVSDPTQDPVDRFGRSLFYVDRTDGVDVGEEMLRAGWANVFVFAQDFQRLSRYRAARTEARDADAGVWGLCGGDFHRTRADELRERRLAAVAFTRRYYRRISNHQFATAWGISPGRCAAGSAPSPTGGRGTAAHSGFPSCRPEGDSPGAGRWSACGSGLVIGTCAAEGS
jgi:nuclease-like protein